MMRSFVLSMLVLFSFFAPLSASAEPKDLTLPEVKVWKSPTCGCCGKWAQHLRDNGFTVKEINTPSMAAIKRSVGIGQKLASCHTAIVGDYVIEGHVPAQDIKRLLSEKRSVKGLTVPGMPLGSPGMEQADGTKEKYDVLSFDENGKVEVFAKH